MAGTAIIAWEEGWNAIQEKLILLRNIVLDGNGDDYDPLLHLDLNRMVKKMIDQPAPHNYSARLYHKYGDLLKEFIQSNVNPPLADKDGELLLSECEKSFSAYREFMEHLLVVFRQLPTLENLPRPDEAGVTFFTTLVYQPIKDRLLYVTTAMINQEREGGKINRQYLKRLLVETARLKVDGHFFPEIWKTTTVYYTQKASGWLHKSWKEYMSEANHCLEQEDRRVSYYISNIQKAKLIKQLRELLLIMYLEPLWKKGHIDADELGVDKLEEFSWFFSPRVPKNLVDAASNFNQYVTNTGIVLFKKTGSSTNKSKVFVRDVLTLHGKFTTYVNDCLLNHALFEEALNKALDEVFRNDVSGTSSMQLIALFCDETLERAGSSELCNEVTERTLKKVSELLACLPRKEEFYDFYWKKFAVRLLNAEYPYNESERRMLGMLGIRYPSPERLKMMEMAKDLKKAREPSTDFEEFLSNTPNAEMGIDLQVTVLNPSLWPRGRTLDINLPPEMATCCKLYNDFFGKKNEKGPMDLKQNKVLRWLFSKGTCDIETAIGGRKLKLIVTPAQAIVLQLFNDTDSLTCDEIKSRLNLSHKDVARLLNSLSTSKCQILRKQTDTGTAVSLTDIFAYNPTFSPKRGTVTAPRLSEDTRIVMSDKRMNAIDGLVLRIMKDRKVLGHDELVSECIKQLYSMFKPARSDIKARIVDLIDRDFLERDQKNRKVLRYLPGSPR